jgi:hypothetical protein
LFNTFAPNTRVAVSDYDVIVFDFVQGFRRVPDRQVTLPDTPYRLRGLDIGSTLRRTAGCAVVAEASIARLYLAAALDHRRS